MATTTSWTGGTRKTSSSIGSTATSLSGAQSSKFSSLASGTYKTSSGQTVTVKEGTLSGGAPMPITRTTTGQTVSRSSSGVLTTSGGKILGTTTPTIEEQKMALAQSGAANYQTITGEPQKITYSQFATGVPDTGITSALSSKGVFGTGSSFARFSYSPTVKKPTPETYTPAYGYSTKTGTVNIGFSPVQKTKDTGFFSDVKTSYGITTGTTEKYFSGLSGFRVASDVGGFIERGSGKAQSFVYSTKQSPTIGKYSNPRYVLQNFVGTELLGRTKSFGETLRKKPVTTTTYTGASAILGYVGGGVTAYGIGRVSPAISKLPVVDWLSGGSSIRVAKGLSGITTVGGTTLLVAEQKSLGAKKGGEQLGMLIGGGIGFSKGFSSVARPKIISYGTSDVLYKGRTSSSYIASDTTYRSFSKESLGVTVKEFGISDTIPAIRTTRFTGTPSYTKGDFVVSGSSTLRFGKGSSSFSGKSFSDSYAGIISGKGGVALKSSTGRYFFSSVTPISNNVRSFGEFANVDILGSKKSIVSSGFSSTKGSTIEYTIPKVLGTKDIVRGDVFVYGGGSGKAFTSSRPLRTDIVDSGFSLLQRESFISAPSRKRLSINLFPKKVGKVYSNVPFEVTSQSIGRPRTTGSIGVDTVFSPRSGYKNVPSIMGLTGRSASMSKPTTFVPGFGIPGSELFSRQSTSSRTQEFISTKSFTSARTLSTSKTVSSFDLVSQNLFIPKIGSSTRSMSSSYSDVGSSFISQTGTVSPPVPPPPSDFLGGFGGFGVPSFGLPSGVGDGGKRTRRSFSYVPSLSALAFNIRGKKQKNLVGFEVRPIAYTKRKRKR